MYKKILSLMFLIGLFLCAACEARQLAVVVDKANTTQSLSAADLTKILKGDNHKWSDGKQIVLIVRDASGPDLQLALQKLCNCNMSADEFKALLAARKNPVMFVDSEEQLLKSVKSTPGAVGLVDVYSLVGGVNVLKVDGKLPLEPGYVLRGGQ
jgi:ABC-type phosphate transport system substrate-binding protein